jgi:hypothetical protein
LNEPASHTFPESSHTGNVIWRRPFWQLTADKIYTILAILFIGYICWQYGRAVDTEILGFIHDDGVYAITAKALAEGKGFTLLHVVTHPAEIKYPFMYPLLLAVVWLINPHFPQNLMMLNGVALLSGGAAFWVLYQYLRRCRQFPGWLALLVIALIAANFFFIYFFSAVMSEAPYFFFSLLTLWLFCRACQRSTQLSKTDILWLGFWSAVTFLTRIPGITLMAAIGTWLLLNKQWRNALLYGTLCLSLGILPWMLWVKLHTPHINDFNYPIVNAYSNYGLELAHNIRTSRDYMAALRGDAISLMKRLLEVMFPLLPNYFKIYPALKHHPEAQDWFAGINFISIYALVGYFVLQGVSTLRRAFQGGRFSAAPFSVPGLYLFYYLIIITLWNYEDQMARFLLMMTPLLWLFFFKPFLPALANLRLPIHRAPIKSWIALVLVIVFGALSLWPTNNSYRIVYKSRSEHWVESGKIKWLWDDYKHSFAWINAHLPKEAPLAVGTDTVFYLYTDHPTLYVFYASLRKAKGRFLPNSTALLMNSIDHYGARYLVTEPHMQFRTIQGPMNKVARSLLQKFPDRFRLVYASPHQAIGVYEILPPAKRQSPAMQ